MAENLRFTVGKADEHIRDNAGSVKGDLRHVYHAMPPIGWMNDPNGFCYAADKYHLFFQFYPYSAAWGPMHWGHLVSKDLIKWEWVKTALAPDEEYDKDGCFSGSSVEKGGEQYLFYTAVKDGKQTQAAAVSSDGRNFVKLGVVIPSDKLPENCSDTDFRDPYVFERDGKYYMVCGSKAKDGDGQILLFVSSDLKKWDFVGVVRKDKDNTSGMYECPCMCSVDGYDVSIACSSGFEREDSRYESVNSSIYSVGRLDIESGKFIADFEDEIDGGLDFYAPQTLTDPDGRTVMIAWMQMWNRSMPTTSDGWAGACTLPRKLEIRDGRLFQQPVAEIEKYRKNRVGYDGVGVGEHTVLSGVIGTSIELSVRFDLNGADEIGIKLFESKSDYVTVSYLKREEKAVFDRSRSGVEISCGEKEKNACTRSVKVKDKNGVISFRIFLDVSSCEVFINDGEKVMTSNVYTAGRGDGISFFAKGGRAEIVSLVKYDIAVNND